MHQLYGAREKPTHDKLIIIYFMTLVISFLLYFTFFKTKEDPEADVSASGYVYRCATRRFRLRQSAIIAMNSLLVGFPFTLDTV